MIDHIDGENRLIYLDASTVNTSIHPIEIYRAVRTLRNSDESLRKYNSFMRGDGNTSKGGGKFTERYFTLLDGTRIVPYDISHVLTITGTLITDDGQEGVFAFNRVSLTAGVAVDIQYIPPQVEIITIETVSAVTAQDKVDIATQVWDNVSRTLTSTGDVGITAQEVWEYTNRELTVATGGLDEGALHVGLDSYINKDDWKADVSNLSADVNVVEVAGVAVTGVDDFKADVSVVEGKVDGLNDFDAAVDVVGRVTLVDTTTTNTDMLAAVDLSGIPAEVWSYVQRELTVAAGLTPEQEAKLDEIIVDISEVPQETYDIGLGKLV